MTSRFGVPPLDGALGDIPAHAAILVRHDPNVEALAFLLQAAGTHARAGIPVVVLSGNRPPSRVRWLLRDYGEADAGVLVVDAYSALMGMREEGCVVVPDPQDLNQVAAALETVADPQAVLLVDSLSGLLDHSSGDRFIAAFPRLDAAFRRFRFTAALHTDWPYGREVEQALSGFDAVVRVRGVEDRVVLNQTFQVDRSRWGAPVGPTLYKVAKPGGVVVHVPKVLVVGPHNAGKSTFIHSVAAGAVSVDRAGTTVALDHGTATLDSTQVEVWGTPGQDRFDPLLPTLAGQASGAILLLDATQPAAFVRGQEMLQKVWRRGLRVVIALNKQDLPGAVDPDEARRLLHAPPDIDILTCTASDAASARAVLQRLVSAILGGAP